MGGGSAQSLPPPDIAEAPQPADTSTTTERDSETQPPEHAKRHGNVPTHRQLLTTAALVEILAGLPLILAPGAAIELLLGAGPDSVGLMIGRVLGVALLVLGISCWGARADPGGPARSGTLRAITLYNAGVGLLLVAFAASGQARGPVLWSAAALHLALAAGFAAPPRPRNGGG